MDLPGGEFISLFGCSMKILMFLDYLSRIGIAVFLIIDIAFNGLISKDLQLGGIMFFLFSFLLVKFLLYRRKKN